jgi:hypothetical protein
MYGTMNIKFIEFSPSALHGRFYRGVKLCVSLDFSYEHGIRIFVKTLLQVLFERKNDDVTKRQVHITK